MFKKLKKRILILNMIIINVILLLTFIIVYTTNYINTYTEIYNNTQITNITSIKPNQSLPLIHSQNSLTTSISSFDLIIEDDEIINTYAYYEFETQFYEEVLSLITEDNNGTIKYDDNTWFYTINSGTELIEGDYIVSFTNITDKVNSLNNLLYILILTWLITTVFVYFICKYYSTKFIKPIEETYEKQKQFIADASHELKTPIAVISANADVLSINSDKTIKSQEKWLSYIKKETKSMSKLVNDLLTLAKSEEVKLDIKDINISKLLNDTIISLEAIAYEKNIKIKSSIEKDINMQTDYNKLKQIYTIFIDNAIKYSEPNNHINISLKRIKKDIVFQIENKAHINEKDISKIFDRFYKCDKSRSNNKSYGLGLAIANNIINELKYEVKVKQENNCIEFSIKM